MANTTKYNGNLNILGSTIKMYRVEKLLSLEQLSYKLQLLGVNLSASSIYKIENNQRAIKDFEIIALCKSLQITYEQLFKHTEEHFN